MPGWMGVSELETMQNTRIRILAVSLGALAGLAACGQVTGLSDDYLFDLTEGGAATGGDASGDASKSDAPGTGDAAADARDATARACTVPETTNALQHLQAFGGTALCKTCLAGKCCTDVVECAGKSECGRVLGCKLDCTERSGVDRTNCYKSCNNSNGGPPMLFTNGVGACSTASCASDCAFQ